MQHPPATNSALGGPRPDGALRRLQLALRVVGVGWTLFFSVSMLNELLDSLLWDRHSGIGQYIMWGHGGREYLLMLCFINIPLGLFLIAAANAPTKHRMFLDFAISTNIVHLGGMMVMAIVEPSQHINLIGDVPLGLIPNIILAVLWLPIRTHGEDSPTDVPLQRAPSADRAG